MAGMQLQMERAVEALPAGAAVAKAGPVVAVILGGLAIVAAATVFAAASITNPREPHTSSPWAEAEAAHAGTDVSVTELSYPPGHSSGCTFTSECTPSSFSAAR